MSKLSDQIRQEYREAVACAVEGKDDIQAWGKVYQSLSKAIFSAWLSSVADNTEGIEECEVAKLIFAKSDCGAGKDGSAGFQPGNTCAGEGGTNEDSVIRKIPRKIEEEKAREINLKTVRQKIQNTPEFKKWFGDSKTINTNYEGKPVTGELISYGNQDVDEPLVLYHGTRANFNEFDVNEQGSGLWGKGFYFALDPDIASSFTEARNAQYLVEKGREIPEEQLGGNIIPAYVKIEKPVNEALEPIKNFPEDFRKEYREHDAKNSLSRLKWLSKYITDRDNDPMYNKDGGDPDWLGRKSYLESLKQVESEWKDNPERDISKYKIPGNKEISYGELFDFYESKLKKEDSGISGWGSSVVVYEAVHELLKPLGYDGYIGNDTTNYDVGGSDYIQEREGGYVAMAFYPEQIKSAIANTGDFDPDSKKITHAKSDCGAGKDDAPGFQPGNTCAGEGGGATSSTQTERRTARTAHRALGQAHDNEYDWYKDRAEANAHVVNAITYDLVGHEGNVVGKYLSAWHTNPDEIEPHIASDIELLTKDYVELDKVNQEMHSIWNDLDLQGMDLTNHWDKYAEKARPILARILHSTMSIQNSHVGKQLQQKSYTNKKAKDNYIDENGIYRDKSSYNFTSLSDFIDKKFRLVSGKDVELHVVTSEVGGNNKKYEHSAENSELFEKAIVSAQEMIRNAPDSVKFPKKMEIGYGTMRKGRASSTRLASFMGRGYKNSSPLEVNIEHRIGHNKAVSSDERGYTSVYNEDNVILPSIIHEFGHVVQNYNLAYKHKREYIDAVRDFEYLDRSDTVRIEEFLEDNGNIFQNWHKGFRLSLQELAFEEIHASDRKLITKDEKDKRRDTALEVSEYASSEDIEFFAETFTGLMFNKKYGDNVMKQYKEMGGSWE